VKKRKKLVILILVTVVLGGGYAAKMFLLPKKKPPVQKIAGQLVTLTPDFLINLSGGHYGKLTVALQLRTARVGKPGSAVALPEDAAVRANVTDTLTGLSSNDLIDRGRRHQLQTQILRALQARTDEPVENVLFTDIAVQ
jgi:flagellar basal body-associated protein FliL